MPKYVFELSVILPATEEMQPRQLESTSLYLEFLLQQRLRSHGFDRFETAHETPFEHVGGSFLPPDANGVIKLGPPTSIDLP